MAEASVLQEYLVLLGFRIDEATHRRFQDGLGNLRKAVMQLQAELNYLIAAVDQLVGKTARSFEGLFYASQRTGETVKNIGALEYAFKMVGLNSDQARSSLERFQTALATKSDAQGHGLKGYLRQLGVPPGTPAEEYAGLMQKLGAMPPAMRQGVGQTFEQDYATITQIFANLPEFMRAIEQFKEDQAKAGINPAADAQKYVEYERSVTKLGNALDNLRTVIADDLVGPISDVVKLLTAIINKFTEKDEKTGQSWYDWARNIFGRFNVLAEAGVAGGTAYYLARQMRKAVGLPVAELGEGAISRAFPYVVNPWAAVAADFVMNTGALNVGEGKTLEKLQAPSAMAAVSEYLQSKFGWSKAAAAGITARLYRESGLNAMASNVDSDNKIHRGLASWSPERWAEMGKFLGKNPDTSSLEDQIAFVDYELNHRYKTAGDMLRNNTTDPIAAYYTFTKYHERPKNIYDWAQGEAMASQIFNGGNQAKNTTVNMNYDIDINGVSGMDRGFINQFSNVLKAQNGDMLRYLRSNAQ